MGPELIQITLEKIEVIRKKLQTAQSRQKSYADKRRCDLEISVGDCVFLKVSPTKGVFRFGKKGKLSPRFIGPYEILERIGAVAYRLALPLNLLDIDLVFHVSMLQKHMSDPSHVLEAHPIELRDDVTNEVQPETIVDRQVRKLRSKNIASVKVKWKGHSIEEATWELKDKMREEYPHLFDNLGTYSNIYLVSRTKLL